MSEETIEIEKKENLEEIDEKILKEEGEDESSDDSSDDSAEAESDSEPSDDSSEEEKDEEESSEEDKSKEEEKKDEESSSSDEESKEDEDKKEDPVEPFSNLDLVKFKIFGKTGKIGSSWTDIAKNALQNGWKNVNKDKFERSLQKNVDACYSRIASFIFKNIDDDVEYEVYFDNNKQLWDFQIKDSPQAELTIEERGNLFKSEPVKKVVARAFEMINSSFKTFYGSVQDKLENGYFLNVDEVKLSALLFLWDKKYFKDNFRTRKYLSDSI